KKVFLFETITFVVVVKVEYRNRILYISVSSADWSEHEPDMGYSLWFRILGTC
ncbi:hypothetical protein RYX36_021154, partial [Vicia faba]